MCRRPGRRARRSARCRVPARGRQADQYRVHGRQLAEAAGLRPGPRGNGGGIAGGTLRYASPEGGTGRWGRTYAPFATERRKATATAARSAAGPAAARRARPPRRRSPPMAVRNAAAGCWRRHGGDVRAGSPLRHRRRRRELTRPSRRGPRPATRCRRPPRPDGSTAGGRLCCPPTAGAGTPTALRTAIADDAQFFRPHRSVSTAHPSLYGWRRGFGAREAMSATA